MISEQIFAGKFTERSSFSDTSSMLLCWFSALLLSLPVWGQSLPIVESTANAYAIFGIEPNASDKEIKSAYYRLVKKLHPDQFAKDPALQKRSEEALKKVNSAYAILSDPVKSRAYEKGEIDLWGSRITVSGTPNNPSPKPSAKPSATQQKPPPRQEASTSWWNEYRNNRYNLLKMMQEEARHFSVKGPYQRFPNSSLIAAFLAEDPGGLPTENKKLIQQVHNFLLAEGYAIPLEQFLEDIAQSAPNVKKGKPLLAYAHAIQQLEDLASPEAFAVLSKLESTPAFSGAPENLRLKLIREAKTRLSNRSSCQSFYSSLRQ